MLTGDRQFKKVLTSLLRFWLICFNFDQNRSQMDSGAEGDLGHYARRLTKEEHDRINVNQSMSDWQRNKLGDEMQFSGRQYRETIAINFDFPPPTQKLRRRKAGTNSIFATRPTFSKTDTGRRTNSKSSSPTNWPAKKRKGRSCSNWVSVVQQVEFD